MGSLQHGALRGILPLLVGAVALCAVDQANPDDQPQVLSACEDVADFSAARTPDEPSFDFSAWETTVFAGARVRGSSLRWHLQPSGAAQTSARLALARPLAGAPESVAVWVKNPNAHQLALRLEIVDGDGARYLSAPANLAEEAAWREIAFDLREMTGPSNDPSPGIDAPIVRGAFVLEGLTEGRPHTIYLDEITARVSERPALRVANLRCPTSLGPGEPLPVRAEFSPATPALSAREARVTAELASADGGAVAWTPMEISETGAGPTTGTATLRVPEWVTPGRYEVRLNSDAAGMIEAEPVGVVVGGAASPPVRASIDAGLSPPAIVLGDTHHRPVMEELRGSLPGILSENVTLVGLPATTDRHPFAWAPGPLTEPSGELNFAPVDRRAAAVLNARPEAALLLQIFIDATPKWEEAHPEHLVRFSGETLAPPAIIAGDRSHPDIVSPTWQRDAAERLRALVRHVENSPWSHRVIGYELQAGDLGAWRPWGASLGIGDEATDIRHQAFLGWLHDNYADVNDLRDGWLGRRRGFGRPQAGFEAVEIPLPLEDAPEPSLYDPASDQPMIDLQHFHAEAPADAMLKMAAAVRADTPEGTLVGACYGHLPAQARANDWSWPHTALTRVLEQGKLDLLTGPHMRIDDPAEPSSLGESIRRAGALYLERPSGAEAVADDCGAMMPAGAAAELVHLPQPEAPSPGATVIEVVDDVSARYLSGDGALPKELLTRPIAGSIPHETYLLRDLLSANPPQGRAWIFRDVFTITAEDGRLLARNTARDDSLLIWVYAPGAIDRYLITGRTMQYLTGIKLSPLSQRGRFTIQPETGLLTPFGFSHSVSPMFMSADEDAEWLGSVAGTDPERCGFALRKFSNCTSVFSLAPPTEQVVRHLARRARIDPGPDTR